LFLKLFQSPQNKISKPPTMKNLETPPLPHSFQK
jgi:hypothetical protein